MGLLFFTLSLLLAFSSHHGACEADDRLVPGKSLLVNQTVVSAAGTFALGFFTPGNSTLRCYLGIWYNGLPERTVVWVANRENPLTHNTAHLAFTRDGNIALLDAEGGVLWSSNATRVPSGTPAVLLDTGNLVLGNGDGNYAWQSFEHPTNTGLPSMKLRMSLRTGVGNHLTSWRDAGDPSPGEFSLGLLPGMPFQLAIWRGSDAEEVLWRSTVWNGAFISLARATATNTANFLITVDADQEEIHTSFSILGQPGLARYVIEAPGRLRLFFMAEDSEHWTSVAIKPSRPCDFYGRCGPYGVCYGGGGSELCRCLRGFVPRYVKDWKAREYSSGCVRRVPVNCGGGDRLLALPGMKLPDRWEWVRNLSDAGCRAECLTRCRCAAYAYDDVKGVWGSSRCLIWEGELLDLELVGSSGEDLYVRLAASEIDADADADTDAHTIFSKKFLLITVLPSFALVMLVLAAFGYSMKRLRTPGNRQGRKAVLFGELKESGMSANTEAIKDLPLFNFSALLAATDNFSSANKLGEGGFGPVYKGKLCKDKEVAVKRLSKVSGQGFEEFRNEVQLIARLQHMNLVRLLGWCLHGDEKILVYEYLPNKSLDKFIFDPSRSEQLDWERRFRIIEGIAQGLLYLHRHSRIRIIHRDLKTSNVLLDAEMNPKISDFGLARIIGVNQTEANTQRVVGTYGYMAPEYALDGLFSDKSDVFSFGVIMLEIITGKRSTGFYPYKESFSLLGYAWQFWKEGRALELIDPSVMSVLVTHEILKCIQVALLCVQENSIDRPAMSSVVFMLDSENPMLPSPKQPAFAVGRNATATDARTRFQ